MQQKISVILDDTFYDEMREGVAAAVEGWSHTESALASLLTLVLGTSNREMGYAIY